MDDTTRRVGRDRDDMSGRGDETTRNLDTSQPPAAIRVRPADPAVGPDAVRARTTTPAGPANTANTRSRSDLDPDTDRKARRIEAEIADTREELSETIDALQEKLRPSNLAADAKNRVKTATSERVRHMAESAGGTAQDMMRSTRHATSGMMEGAKQNPIPALMIGLGVAWLLVDRTRSHDGRSRSSIRSRYGDADPYRAGRVPPAIADEMEGDVGYGYAEYGYGESGESYAESARRVSGRASEAAGRTRETLRRSTRSAQNGLQRLMRDNPLLVGAAAVVAGAAVGAALPETERENEMMGETRDSMLEKGKDMARNAASTAQSAVGDAAKSVAERVVSGDNQESRDR